MPGGLNCPLAAWGQDNLTTRHSEGALQSLPNGRRHTMLLRDGRHVQVRTVVSSDRSAEQEFVRGLSEQSRYFRFLSAVRELPPDLLERFTVDGEEHHVGLVALLDHSDPNSAPCVIGDAHFVISGNSADFALAIADRWQGHGIGRFLLRTLVDAARQRGLARLTGEVLHDNRRMLALARDAGFRARHVQLDPRVSEIELLLEAPLQRTMSASTSAAPLIGVF